MTLLIVILAAPALSMVKLWAKKHLVTSSTKATSEAAGVVVEIL